MCMCASIISSSPSSVCFEAHSNVRRISSNLSAAAAAAAMLAERPTKEMIFVVIYLNTNSKSRLSSLWGINLTTLQQATAVLLASVDLSGHETHTCHFAMFFAHRLHVRLHCTSIPARLVVCLSD